MKKIAAIVLLWFLAGVSSAHRERILPISADGTLGDIPAKYGPVRVHFARAVGDPTTLTRVSLTSPRFTASLNPCVVAKLKDVTHIEASGSWYHEGRLPPYVSLTSFSGKYAPSSPTNAYYSVTFSLLDGRILMGGRAWDPLFGAWRTQYIDPADKCPHWERLGMAPNNSLKPQPLRSLA